MNIKKGDNVIVISGADKGKTGKVVAAFPARSKVIIEGVNLKKKHQRKTREDQRGQVVERPLPLVVSKVMLIDPSNNQKTRIGKKEIDGKRVRISIKTGKEI